MTAGLPYRRGVVEVGDGLFAYLQPDGGWGLSNAGLVRSEGSSLLVDTLFDLALTAAMLESMAALLRDAPIEVAFNTHGNGDHCFGNQLLPEGIEIHSTAAAATAMAQAPPAAVCRMLGDEQLGPEWIDFARERFGRFSFADIELRAPTSTFTGSRHLDVAGRRVDLIELGPAHSEGDAIAHIPDARVVFTGDIVFVGGTPIIWAGPASNWLAACERILELGADTIVPGHGPITDAAGVSAVGSYLRHVGSQARARFDAGMSAAEAADDIELGAYGELGDPERIVVNVETFYREFDPSRAPVAVPALFAGMARWRARH